MLFLTTLYYIERINCNNNNNAQIGKKYQHTMALSAYRTVSMPCDLGGGWYCSSASDATWSMRTKATTENRYDEQ